MGGSPKAGNRTRRRRKLKRRRKTYKGHTDKEREVSSRRNAIRRGGEEGVGEE